MRYNSGSTTDYKRIPKNMGRRKAKTILNKWQLYLMTLPAVAYILLFHYKPMYGIIIAFKNYSLAKGIWESPWVGFNNFTRLFGSYWFPIIVKNTLSISLLSLVFSFPFPIILALMVNEITNERLRKTFQTVSYAPHFISTVVICGMIMLFLNPTSGIVNRLLVLLGMDSVPFMQKAHMFKWIYVISGIWQHSGWSAIIYYAALSAVSKEHLESADIDGASRLQKTIYIKFPVLVPTIIILLIMNCGSLLSVGYEKVYLLQTSTNLSGSEVISTYVYKMGLERQDFAFSTATGLFNSAVNCIILVIVNSVAKKYSETSMW